MFATTTACWATTAASTSSRRPSCASSSSASTPSTRDGGGLPTPTASTSGETTSPLPSEAEGCHHVYHQFTLTDRRDQLQGSALSSGIASAIYYPVPLLPAGGLPTAQAAGISRQRFPAARVLSLPMFPEITEEEILTISGVIKIRPDMESLRTVMIVAGEASGDLHGAHLVREMKALDPTLAFCGVGGQRLAAEGVRLVARSSEMGGVVGHSRWSSPSSASSSGFSSGSAGCSAKRSRSYSSSSTTPTSTCRSPRRQNAQASRSSTTSAPRCGPGERTGSSASGAT